MFVKDFYNLQCDYSRVLFLFYYYYIFFKRPQSAEMLNPDLQFPLDASQKCYRNVTKIIEFLNLFTLLRVRLLESVAKQRKGIS